MSERILTIDDDWGEKGNQATGAQVQSFIKNQIRSLENNDAAIMQQLSDVRSETNDLQNKVMDLETSRDYLQEQINNMGNSLADEMTPVIEEKVQEQINVVETDLNTGLENLDIKIDSLGNSIIEGTLTSDLRAANSGVYIYLIIYDEWDVSKSYLVPYWKYEEALKLHKSTTRSPIVVGISVFHPFIQPFLVACDEKLLKFAISNTVTYLTTVPSTSYPANHYEDMNGQAFTQDIINAKDTLFGADVDISEYAAGWCYQYAADPQELSGQPAFQHQWYLPSTGELGLIRYYSQEINNCLSAVGAELLKFDIGRYYWSSRKAIHSTKGEGVVVTSCIDRDYRYDWGALVRPVKKMPPFTTQGYYIYQTF